MGITAADIESTLGKLRDLPTPVSSWRVKTGLDWTDDPAVWVWAMLEDEDVDFGKRSDLREMVRNLIRTEIDADPWVYVMFRGATETE